LAGFGGNNSGPGNSVASGVIGAVIAGGGGISFNGSSLVQVPNSVTASWGTIGGGFLNVAAGDEAATVGGGLSNTASGLAFVGGGEGNNASFQHATVGGGFGNSASGESATVPGGDSNTASGSRSFAAGTGAVASSEGAFVWADDACCGAVNDTGVRTFTARASGGFTFYTSPTLSTGATLPAGSGSWASLSDRNVKANVMAVDGRTILERLASLPIATWNYTAQSDSVRHMGPMAQDFRAAFGLGEDERHISTVDSEGVALAAIQELYKLSQQQVEELTRQLHELQNQVARLTGTR
jgi:hypothetical protein